MKNILKKLGVFGLIIAMIIPFIELPAVKAEGECTDHTLQQYMFLDITNGNYWQHYTTRGYATYTSYANLFPIVNSDQTINVLGVNVINDFTSETSTRSGEASLPKFYAAVESAINKSDYTINKLEEIGTYTKKSTTKYALETLLHGYWARETNSSRQLSAGWFEEIQTMIDNGTIDDETVEEYFINHTIQSVLNNNDIRTTNSTYGVDISGAKLNGNSYTADEGYELEEFMDAIANRKDDELLFKGDNTKFKDDDLDSDTEYFSLRINRYLDESLLKNLTFGYDDENGNFYAFSTKADSVENSYSALKKAEAKKNVNKEGVYAVSIDESKIDIRTDLPYYWPVIMTVEYQVCNDSSNPSKGQWELVYNKNVSDDSVTNMPKGDKADNGTIIAVSSTEPKREGYAFQGWCQDSEKCSNPVKSGYEVKSDVSKTITMYAQWGPTGAEKQKPTGVVSYVIGFISVGIVAGGIYLIAKRKNLFKQI